MCRCPLVGRYAPLGLQKSLKPRSTLYTLPTEPQPDRKHIQHARAQEYNTAQPGGIIPTAGAHAHAHTHKHTHTHAHARAHARARAHAPAHAPARAPARATIPLVARPRPPPQDTITYVAVRAPAPGVNICNAFRGDRMCLPRQAREPPVV